MGTELLMTLRFLCCSFMDSIFGVSNLCYLFIYLCTSLLQFFLLSWSRSYAYRLMNWIYHAYRLMSWIQWQKSMKKIQLKYQMVNWTNALQRIYYANTRIVLSPISHLDYVKHVTRMWVISSWCILAFMNYSWLLPFIVLLIVTVW